MTSTTSNNLLWGILREVRCAGIRLEAACRGSQLSDNFSKQHEILIKLHAKLAISMPDLHVKDGISNDLFMSMR